MNSSSSPEINTSEVNQTTSPEINTFEVNSTTSSEINTSEVVTPINEPTASHKVANSVYSEISSKLSSECQALVDQYNRDPKPFNNREARREKRTVQFEKAHSTELFVNDYMAQGKKIIPTLKHGVHDSLFIRHDLENSAYSLVVPAYDERPNEYNLWAFNLIFDTIKPDGTFYPTYEVREIIGGKVIELIKPAIINAQGELVEKGIVRASSKK